MIICRCGQALPKGTTYIEGLGTKECCPQCGEVYRVDHSPIDWEKICGGKK